MVKLMSDGSMRNSWYEWDYHPLCRKESWELGHTICQQYEEANLIANNVCGCETCDHPKPTHEQYLEIERKIYGKIRFEDDLQPKPLSEEEKEESNKNLAKAKELSKNRQKAPKEAKKEKKKKKKKEEVFTCDVRGCSYDTPSKRGLSIHITKTHLQECDVKSCEFETTSKQGMSLHVSAKHSKKSKKKKKPKVLSCDEHPGYGAIRKPRRDCKTCWEAYANKHPDRV